LNGFFSIIIRAIRKIHRYRGQVSTTAGGDFCEGTLAMTRTTPSERAMLPALRGIPTIDLNRHVTLALHAGRSASAIALEALRLMRGPGKLSGSEYFYYRLWDEGIDLERKRQFVGRKAQTLMHVACNDRHWYQTAADKVLFQTIMTGAGLPVPEMLAITQRVNRRGIRTPLWG
jgi:hypothetical protein